MKKEREKDKEKKEQYHLDVFSELQSLPGEKLPRGKNQIPDFRFSNDGKIIGIEHTELKFSSKLTELKGIQRKVVAKAKQIAEQKKLPPLKVVVIFHDYFCRHRIKVNEIANALYTTINSNLQIILDREDGHSIEIDPPDPFVGISSILANPGKIYGETWLNEHSWCIDEVGFVSRNFINDLQSSIDKKNSKINDYLNNCDTCWLLVVANRYKADQKYEFSEFMNKYIFNSEFHKTFFIEIAEKLLIKLKTK